VAYPYDSSSHMLRAGSKCTRVLKTTYSHRISKPLPRIIRKFKTGPNLINDFGKGSFRYEALPIKKRLKIRCNFNHWLAAELQLFKRADDIPLPAILAWSAFMFYVMSTLLSFVFLIWITEKIENEELTEDALAIYRSRYSDQQLSGFHGHRDMLEINCFSDILAARADLVEAFRYYKAWVAGILSGTFGYYLFMGKKLGIAGPTNLTLGLKRLCRRRGFAWNTVLIGYFCLNMSSLNYYYVSYILGPKYRALSLMPDDYGGIKRKFMSAYGGRGLALHRILADKDVKNEKVLELARQVAFHADEHHIDQGGEIKLAKSHVFKGGYGFQYRAPKACDGMPEHCWFKNIDEVKNYVEAIKIVAKRMQKNQPKKHEENKNAKKQPEEQPGAQHENFRLGIGMAYGANDDWETRFIKASHNELAKASLERLEVLQLLSKVHRITKEYSQKPLYSSLYEYSHSLRPFKKTLNKLYSVKYYVEGNHEKYCLCHYYPYYVGAFPQ